MTDLLLKALDFLLGGLLEKWRQRKALSGQLEALKRHILNVSLINNYPVELAKLRAFLFESGLVEKPQFKEFFQRWLSDPIVAEGRPVLGLFSSEQIAELLEELACLQL